MKLNGLWKGASSVEWQTAALLAFQLVIVGYAIFWTWGRIKGTQAERLVKGIVVLTTICWLSWLLHLTLITSLLQQLIPIAVVCLVIIFQPEIRRGLGHLGKTTFRLDLTLADTQRQKRTQVIAHLISAVRELCRDQIGALIVIEPLEGERDYLSPGTTINADITANLLVSIFQPKSPLHDGAVVIRGDKLLAAGVILPITDNPKLSYRYGTRHRAAIGLSEIYDGLCIVVSEETGAISAANRGMLVRYNSPEELRDPLSYFYYESQAGTAGGPLRAFLSILGANRGNASATTSGDSANRRAPTPTVAFDPSQLSVDSATALEREHQFSEDVRQSSQSNSD